MNTTTTTTATTASTLFLLRCLRGVVGREGLAARQPPQIFSNLGRGIYKGSFSHLRNSFSERKIFIYSSFVLLINLYQFLLLIIIYNLSFLYLIFYY